MISKSQLNRFVAFLMIGLAPVGVVLIGLLTSFSFNSKLNFYIGGSFLLLLSLLLFVYGLSGGSSIRSKKAIARDTGKEKTILQTHQFMTLSIVAFVAAIASFLIAILFLH